MSAAIDFNNPEPQYVKIFDNRIKKLLYLSKNPETLEACKLHYAAAPWDFINDWGMTFDPRNVRKGIISSMPFILWPRQVEYLEWLTDRYTAGERGLVEKSRDCGVTWLSVAWAVTMMIFVDGFSAGFGSQKKQKVDRKGDPDSIFEKIRYYYLNVPKLFRPSGFDQRLHMTEMKLINPSNGSTITGEVGDDIGRGGRKTIFFVDEAAHIEHQFAVDAALSQTTDSQIDISTPCGTGNEFYKKTMKFDGTDRKFVFDYTEDPRKNEEWLIKQAEELDEVVMAQEVFRDYEASSDDIFIPAKWIRACIDAHKTLGFEPTGIRVTAFDPADVNDPRAIVNRYGSVVLEADDTKTGDIRHALGWANNHADQFRADVFIYDGDGMGAPVIKVAMPSLALDRMKLVAYHGSAGVVDPNKIPGDDRIGQKQKNRRTEELHKRENTLRTNLDTYQNFRAQSWTWVRERAELTFNAIERVKNGQIVNVNPDDLLSISSECKKHQQLISEISRPKRMYSSNGKFIVESKEQMRKRGVSSPNLADSLVMSMSVRGEIMATKKTMPKVSSYKPFDKGMF